MRTILADDNPEVRAALRLLLEELGERDVVEAADLGQAWTAL
jgi:CheY-like chemotaxis protein